MIDKGLLIRMERIKKHGKVKARFRDEKSHGRCVNYLINNGPHGHIDFSYKDSIYIIRGGVTLTDYYMTDKDGKFITEFIWNLMKYLEGDYA